VIHDRDAVETRVIGSPGNRGQLPAKLLRAPCTAEVRNLQANSHVAHPGNQECHGRCRLR
jgi:hypothetical protein